LPENSLTLRRQNWRRISVLSKSNFCSQQSRQVGLPEFKNKVKSKKRRKRIEIGPAKTQKVELQFSLKKPG
jgi:hypothetical protein